MTDYWDEQEMHEMRSEWEDRLTAENSKLREDLEDQEAYDQMLRDRLRQQTELRVKAEAENAKLRELAAGIGHLLFILDVDYCAACPRDDINHPCPVHTVGGGECLYETDMRELGIEVSA